MNYVPVIYPDKQNPDLYANQDHKGCAINRLTM